MPGDILQRKQISKETEKRVLLASMRKCCLCYFLDNDQSVKRGQIAHLNQNSSQSAAANLVFLCLNHHDDFDSPRSQSKGFQSHEIREYRDRLHRALNTDAEARKPEPEGLTHLHEAENLSAAVAAKLNFPEYSRMLELMGSPWRSPWQPENAPELFAFKSYNLCDGICRLERLNLGDGRVMMICEEIQENPGMSVTNAIELIAFQICFHFDIDPDKLVLIEHYEESFGDRDEWHLVTFSSKPPQSNFENPKWIEMTTSDWAQLGFRPRKRPVKSERSQKSLMTWKQLD
jgi:hypothetical protein